MRPLAGRPRPNFVRGGREDGGYFVIWKGATFGAVMPVRFPGQQTERWLALDTSRPIERAIGESKRTRLEAGQLLIDAAFEGMASR